MTVNVSGAVNAYANASKLATGAAPAAQGGEGFGKMLQDAASNAINTLGKSEALSLQAVSGKADLAAVTEAVTNAQVALQTVVAVRDRVISAYQDIIKMPI